jgi:Tol biopolymer transport system component
MRDNKFSRILLSIIAVAVIFSTFQNAYSQFGKNKVQYKVFDWKFIQSKHFDVYFSQGGYELAQYTAVVAESSLTSLSKNLDYNITNRIPIVVFNSHNEFQQNNVLDDFMPEGVGGVTELFKNRVLIPFEGNYEQYRHVIHHELLHAFMNDMFYGGSIQNIISKNITLNVPIWFSEGMAEYQSLNGLDKATDMYIRDAVLNNNLPPIEYNNGYLAYRGGQSFLSFIADTYGDYKMGELMNNIKSLNDVDFALKETFKLNTEQLSEKWLKQLKKTHWPEIAKREDVKDIGKMLTDHTKDGGFYNVAPTISPKGDRFAFISNRNDFFSVFLADVQTGKIIDKVIEGNNTNSFEELQVLTPGLTWSPDGKKLAISVKAGDRDAIFIINADNGDETRLPVDLNSISQVKWSPFKDVIAFVGTDTKQSDIYIYDISKNKLKNLTNDIFSDQTPTWTPDGKQIYFTSDRGSYLTKESIPPDFKMYNYDVNRKDVYRINVEDGKIERITDSKETKNGYVNFTDDGKKVLYVSDRNGISNIYYGQWDSSGTYSEKPITNSISPIDQLSLSKDAKKLLFVSLNEGGYDIYSMDNPFDKKIEFDTLPPTEFVKKKYDVKKSIFVDRKADSLLHDSSFTLKDSLNTDSTKKFVKIEPDSTSIKVKKDSASIYGSNIKLKLNNKKDPGQKYIDNFDSLYSSNNNFKVDNPTNDDGSFRIKDYKIKFTPDLVYGNAMYSSYYGVQGVATISLSDMLGNHRITFLTSMVIDLKNSDYAVGYQYLPKRIDYGIELYHTARFVLYDKGLGTGSELYRYRTIGANVNLSYPINKFRRLDAGVSFMSITRENLDNGNEPTTRKYYTVPSITLAFDNALYGYIYPEKGSRYYLTTLLSPNLGDESSEFFTLIGDFRKYFKIADNYSFAVRFNGGTSFGKNPQRFYLGGIDNWINWQFENSKIPFGESIDNYAFASTITPLRGYNFNAEGGSKFVLTNMELRFPIFKYLILGALPLGFQNIMGSLFLDAGTAWSDTKNLKLIGTNVAGNTVTNDLLIAPGFGSRIVFLGFPVRMDIAWRYNLHSFSDPMYMFSIGLDY